MGRSERVVENMRHRGTLVNYLCTNHNRTSHRVYGLPILFAKLNQIIEGTNTLRGDSQKSADYRLSPKDAVKRRPYRTSKNLLQTASCQS